MLFLVSSSLSEGMVFHITDAPPTAAAPYTALDIYSAETVSGVFSPQSSFPLLRPQQLHQVLASYRCRPDPRPPCLSIGTMLNATFSVFVPQPLLYAPEGRVWQWKFTKEMMFVSWIYSSMAMPNSCSLSSVKSLRNGN